MVKGPERVVKEDENPMIQFRNSKFLLPAFLGLVVLFSTSPVLSQTDDLQFVFVDHARCAAVAHVKATQQLTPPSKAQHFSREAKRLEASARETGVKAGKTPAQINSMLRYQLQAMSTPNPSFPSLLEDNLALCVKNNLLVLAP